MVLFKENGDFISPRKDMDRGSFTVQSSDVPLGTLRRKHRGHTKINRKKARLTPINEHEEHLMEREESFNYSVHDMDANTPTSVACSSCPTARTSDTVRESPFVRSDTPARYSRTPKLHIELDTFEDELDNILEDGETRGKEARCVVAELPPRPKCKRKVLPPSITGLENEKPKRNKLLRLRSRAQNKVSVASVSQFSGYTVSKDLQRVMAKQTLRLLNERSRPKSAENKVRVIRLSDLSSVNSSSVPDLPSIMQKIAKHNELSSSPMQTQSARLADDRSASSFEDSGALSTPRQEDEKMKSLRGSDMSSFYNMWERDTKRRPFDRKDGDKGRGVQYNRSCMCSLKHCVKNKCGLHRSNVLPPISSPQKELYL